MVQRLAEFDQTTRNLYHHIAVTNAGVQVAAMVAAAAVAAVAAVGATAVAAAAAVCAVSSLPRLLPYALPASFRRRLTTVVVSQALIAIFAQCCCLYCCVDIMANHIAIVFSMLTHYMAGQHLLLSKFPYVQGGGRRRSRGGVRNRRG